MGTTQKGRVFGLYIAPESTTTFGLVGGARTLQVSAGTDTIDVASKDTDDWADFIAGRRDVTIRTDHLYQYDDTAQDTLYDAYFGTRIVEFRISSGVSGDNHIGGTALITRYDKNMDDNDVAQASVELRVKGEMWRTTIT